MTDRLRLRIPARPEYLVLGRLVLSGISRCRPIHPDDLSDLKLALTEACSNSMRHAYAVDEGAAVEIVYEVDDGWIAIEVIDAGSGFEQVQAAQVGDDLDEGGLGLAIIEAVCDETEVGRRADGTGSRLRFRRALARLATETET